MENGGGAPNLFVQPPRGSPQLSAELLLRHRRSGYASEGRRISSARRGHKRVDTVEPHDSG
ncbi:hypothetical protein LINPERPRIM_LOCUS2493 [Linum perenne]